MDIRNSIHSLTQRVGTVIENLKTPAPAQVVDVQDVFAGGVAPEKDWTVLVYMEGKERLAHSTDLALNKLEQVGSTDRANVVVQATQEPLWMERLLPNMKSLPTRRYFVQRDQSPEQVTSPVLKEFSEPVSLTGDSLADFVSWGMKNFPAKHTALIIKKHGAGFASVTRDGRSVVPLSARELSEALSSVEKNTGKKVDLLSFDSCSMQQIEVAYQMRNHCQVMVGSEEDVKAVVHPYGNSLVGLHQLPEGSGAEELGSKLVETYAQRVPVGMHSALKLTSLESVAASVKKLVDELMTRNVPQDLIYTAMLDTKPMDRTETMALGFNFRDLGSFLGKVQEDERFPQEVRQAALQARQDYENSVIARFTSADRKELKAPTGATTFMPWKAPSDKMKEAYGQLDWAQDSGWNQLLGYVLESPQSTQPEAPAKLGKSNTLTQMFGRWGLKQYKKYISPHLNVTCAYTPTCSQFAREAIETHGLWEGGKMGALRFFSCTGQMGGYDPVQGREHVCSDGCGCSKPGEVQRDDSMKGRLGDFLVSPPTTRGQASSLSMRAIALAKSAGAVLGAVGLALLSAPVGAAIGASVGWRAGRGTHQQHLEKMGESYNASIVQGYKNISNPLVEVVEKLHLNDKGVVGGVLGAAVGALAGAAGGAFQGGRWGRTFGSLWAENRTKEALGELPAHPETDAIIKNDYSAR